MVVRPIKLRIVDKQLGLGTNAPAKSDETVLTNKGDKESGAQQRGTKNRKHKSRSR